MNNSQLSKSNVRYDGLDARKDGCVRREYYVIFNKYTVRNYHPLFSFSQMLLCKPNYFSSVVEHVTNMTIIHTSHTYFHHLK